MEVFLLEQSLAISEAAGGTDHDPWPDLAHDTGVDAAPDADKDAASDATKQDQSSVTIRLMKLPGIH